MTAAILIAKLVQIESAVGRAHPFAVRNMVLEAQGCVLEMEQEMIEILRENGRLRERLQICESNEYPRPLHTPSDSEGIAGLSHNQDRKPPTSEVLLPWLVRPGTLA